MNNTYTVKAGDTLYGISNQYGVSVTELAELNKVDANSLKVGQVLTIPIKTGTNPDNMFLYTVKKGDSLYSIAKVYGTTVDKIKALNYLTSNILTIGQVIRIPEMYTKEEDMIVPIYTNYIVKKGDTLYSIAKKYDTTADMIIQDNGLFNTNLKIGQNLKIRTEESEVLECFGEDYTPTNNTEYIVKKGDSLYSIAKKYNSSISEIINLNNLKSTTLNIGQVLKIPNSTNNTYTVKKGDTLYSIANQYNISVSDLKKKNNLTNNNLTIGQILKV